MYDWDNQALPTREPSTLDLPCSFHWLCTIPDRQAQMCILTERRGRVRILVLSQPAGYGRIRVPHTPGGIVTA